jgi:hypothetical protein
MRDGFSEMLRFLKPEVYVPARLEVADQMAWSVFPNSLNGLPEMAPEVTEGGTLPR